MAIDKSKLLKAAEKFIASGKIAPAIDEYLKILKENPKDWNLKIQIGDLYLKLNKPPDAIKYFQDVADHYSADGFFLKAIAIYKRINKLDPNLSEVCMKLADLYLKQGLTMDAKTQLQVVAQHYVSKNQTKEAIQTLKKLIEIEPDNLRSRNELAKAYKNEGMVAEAIQEYLAISDELTRKSLLKESLAVLETAFKLDSRNNAILRKILAVYAEQNDSAKAMALLEDTLKSDPSNSEVLGLLAETFAAKNQYERAHQIIDQAIRNTNEKDTFYVLKGDLFLKEGDLIEAFTQYEFVVDKMVRRREFDKAVALMQKVTKADPSFHPALQRMVELYTSLKQESSKISTYNLLIDAFISKTMYREAAESLDELIRMEPENMQHQEKLEFVHSFLEKPKPAPQPKPAEPASFVPEEPMEMETEDFDLDISIDLGAPPAIPEIVVEPPPPPPVAPKPPVVPTPPAPAPPPKATPAATAMTSETSDEEKEFVSEHLIEAEVFTKYGLIDKAIEQLQIITLRYPNSVLSHQKLKEIYLEKGDRDHAVEECVIMSRIFRKQGDLDQAEDLLSEAQQINPNHPALEKAYKEMPAPAAVESHPAPPSMETLITAPPPPPPPIEAAPAQLPPEPPPPVAKAPTPPPPTPPPARSAQKSYPQSGTFGRADVLGEIEKLAQSVKSKPAPKAPPAKPAPAPPPVAKAAPVPVPPSIPAPKEIVVEFEPPAPEIQPGGFLPPETFEEIDFYTSQGLMSEAHRLLEDLKENHPEDPGVLTRLAHFEEFSIAPTDLVVEVAPPTIEVDSAPPPELINVGIAEPTPAPTEEIEVEIPIEPLPFTMGEAGDNLMEIPASEIVTPQDEPAVQFEVDFHAGKNQDEEIIEVEPELQEVQEEVTEIEELDSAALLLEPEPEIAVSVEVEPSPIQELETDPVIQIPEPESESPPAAEVETPPDLDQPMEIEFPDISTEQEIPLEHQLAQTMDISDLGELELESGLLSDAPTIPGIAMQENPFEGKVSEEPISEIMSVPPSDFGEIVELAEHVVPDSGEEEKSLDFPAERSLDDALDAAFLGDEVEPVAQSKPVQASQELFEEEDDFFDLAAELEEGFLNVQSAVEEERPADGQNYSIEEILTDFKKGVEKQLGSEDYDTRYNLGIAYKEMGLVDEAIAEFQIASKDEKRFLECCSMLGLCFLEKGMPKLALKWYQRGLDTKGYGEEEYLGLRYDMATAYEATGEEDKALEMYHDVYGANASYRNVSKKIKDLQQQLKNK